MTNYFKLLYQLILALCLSLLIVSCDKLSQSNFDKVKPNMTMKEVVAILGNPTKSDSVNIAGVSGTTAVWKDKHAEINIQFLNDQVAVKTFNTVDENK